MLLKSQEEECNGVSTYWEGDPVLWQQRKMEPEVTFRGQTPGH